MGILENIGETYEHVMRIFSGRGGHAGRQERMEARVLGELDKLPFRRKSRTPAQEKKHARLMRIARRLKIEERDLHPHREDK